MSGCLQGEIERKDVYHYHNCSNFYCYYEHFLFSKMQGFEIKIEKKHTLSENMGFIIKCTNRFMKKK